MSKIAQHAYLDEKARDAPSGRQPKPKVVKSLCFRNPDSGECIWRKDWVPAIGGWVRFPSGDLEGVTE